MHRSAKSASDQARDQADAGRAVSYHDGAVPQAVPRQQGLAAQRAKIDAIHVSPHQATQRRKMASAFGPTIQLAAVNVTNLGGVDLKPEVGADFRNSHMAPDRDAAMALSRSAGRLARSPKNTVVLDAEEEVKTALGNTPYSPTPVEVTGLNALVIKTRTRRNSIKPEDVTGQSIVATPTVTKVKVRLAADDDKKTGTAPTPSPTGPVVVATGVSG